MHNTKDKIENIHKNHRKRMKQKFLENGIKNFSEHEILEFLLFYSIPQGDTNALAHILINKYGSLSKVLDAPLASLTETKGVGEHTAILIKLLPQIFKEYQSGRAESINVLKNMSDCYQLASELFCNATVEELYIVCLNGGNSILAKKMIAEGTSDKVIVVMRDITDFILKYKTSRILIYHNHPSEIMEFSKNDENLTSTIFATCILNEIDVVDHILYTHNGCLSMKNTGKLKNIKDTVMDRLYISPSSPLYKKVYCSSKIIEIE